MSLANPNGFLRELFCEGLKAVDPFVVVPPYLPKRPTCSKTPSGKTYVIGAGKAAAKMAQAVESIWQSDIEGAVVTRYGHACPCRHIEVFEAAHPVPDENGLIATSKILEFAQKATKDDLVLCLISGGGSALLTAPIEGLSLEGKQKINQQLLHSGASISEMNNVRKQLSQVKGGGLATIAAPARIVTLLISDVPGDDPSVIASGPTIANNSSPQDALEVIERYGIDISEQIRADIKTRALQEDDAHKEASICSEIHLIATPQMVLEHAAKKAKAHGIHPLILSDQIEGEARDVAKVFAAIARQVKAHGQPCHPPCVLLSGGETTVTITDKNYNGRGGRNVEFLLSLAIELKGEAGLYAIACDTDGVDGCEDVAGAIIGPETLSIAQDAGLDARSFLHNHDGHSFFGAINAQVVTGPTLTNVNDFRAILITKTSA